MRIAIVNDLKMAVEILKRVVNSVPDYEIAWIAVDGYDAVKKCSMDVPDIILMDLIMPVMDGVESTRQIMKYSPCSILVVTATVEGNMSKVFEAMGHGALDAVATPVFGAKGSIKGGDALLDKVATIGKLIGKTVGSVSKTSAKKKPAAGLIKFPSLAVIGSSTGGPKALASIIYKLPENFNAAVVIVQHVDVKFASGLVDWLNSQTPLNVILAKEGKTIKSGNIYVAGTNDHLIMKKDLTLEYTEEPLKCPFRPSVDAFFKSVAKNWPDKSYAAILTGMGADGAKGLKLLRDKGWYTVAQNEETCIVYGMPKAAVEMGAAKKILPLNEIAASLISYFK